MQPIIITLSPHPDFEKIRRQVRCSEFTVKFSDDPDHQRIILPLVIELTSRSETQVPVVVDGQETGESETVYGPWEPYRKLSLSNQVAAVTESNNSKFVDPATFNLVPAGTEGAVPELTAIWSQLGPPIVQLITTVLSRMDQRGNFNDLSQL
ncbi:hypothetical protein [Arsenicibacter rosenii]|nr:hypothetical protein [Arsenicibacter rosenii]